MGRKHATHSPNAFADRLRAMRNGLATNFPANHNLDIAGSATTPTDAIAQIDRTLAVFDAADAAHRNLRAAVSARDAATPAAEALTTDLETALRAAIGTTNPALEQFGLMPKRKRSKPGFDAHVASVEKARASRSKKPGAEPPAPPSPPAK
jgi:hypothetical protein